MNKSLLKQMLNYFSKVYDIGEKIKGVMDKRSRSQIKTAVISFIVLMGFMLIAFNLMQLFFFRCIREFRERNLLQVNVIEDLMDGLVLFCDINPIMINSS